MSGFRGYLFVNLSGTKYNYGYLAFFFFLSEKTFFFYLILKSFIGITLGIVNVTNVKFGSNQRRYVCATSDTK